MFFFSACLHKFCFFPHRLAPAKSVRVARGSYGPLRTPQPACMSYMRKLYKLRHLETSSMHRSENSSTPSHHCKLESIREPASRRQATRSSNASKQAATRGRRRHIVPCSRHTVFPPMPPFTGLGGHFVKRRAPAPLTKQVPTASDSAGTLTGCEDLPSAHRKLVEQMALASQTPSPADRHPTQTAQHSRELGAAICPRPTEWVPETF